MTSRAESPLEEAGEDPVKVLAFGFTEEICKSLIESFEQRSIPVEVFCPASTATAVALAEEQDISLVVMRLSGLGVTERELIHVMRLAESEPALIAILERPDSKLTAALYDAGCQRCIHEEGMWQDETARASRHVLRLRKLEQENRRLITRLTEANRLLEEKNRRLDEFSATLAHDIRGPLAGIGMKLEYVLDKYAQDFPDKSRVLLRSSLAATHRLVSLVQVMYDFAKLGARAAKMGPVQLKPLIEEILGDLPVEPTREIEVGVDNLPEVWGCRELLRRVFLNLLANAVKYNDKATVLINIGCSGTKSTPLAQFLSVYVEDNGPGIPDEEREQIFSIFHRVSAASEKVEGLGIGLAVVQRIIELHFGTIEVDSEQGAGTRFSLWLPQDEIRIAGL